jgi:hypothetical protein
MWLRNVVMEFMSCKGTGGKARCYGLLRLYHQGPKAATLAKEVDVRVEEEEGFAVNQELMKMKT